MPDVEGFFALVAAIAASRPFQREVLGRLTRRRLEEKREESTDYFAVFTSNDVARDAITRVELRVPKLGAAAKDGLVLLHVSRELQIDKGAIMSRCGSAPELLVPTPRQPPDAPLYFVYRRPWGVERFGFSRDAAEHLVSVVLDATGR